MGMAGRHGAELSEDQGVQAVLDDSTGLTLLHLSGSVVQSSAGRSRSTRHPWGTPSL